MITQCTYKIIFDVEPPVSPEGEEKDFIRRFGELDIFLEEIFMAVKSDESASVNDKSKRGDDHKTQVKQRLRQQRHDVVKEKGNTLRENGSAQAINSGMVIGGRYEVKSFIGRGGYGTVYKGLDQQLGRFVAVKILKRKSLADSHEKERFLREGQILAKMSHPHIVQIYDIGEEQDYYFIIMEYIEGKNLEHFIRDRRTQSTIFELTQTMVKISDALGSIHRKGILHRDIKPSNIMVGTEGDPKLMDFGISKSAGEDIENQPTLTGEGSFLGTAEFMSPEQFSSPGQVKAASDVYSLGCTFYKLLTGQNPIPGKTFLEFHKNHLECQPTPIRNIAREIPISLANVIHKMMAKRPEDRYQDGAAVKEALLGVKKKSIRHLTKLLSGFLLTLFGIAVLANVFKPKPEWFPKPRTIAVIPFTEKGSQYSFVSSEFTKLLKSHYNFYNTVERGDIFTAMEELDLNRSDLISKEDSLRIGKLVGAHIFIMFEVKKIKEQEVVYPKAFDVETLLLLGLARIPPETLENFKIGNPILRRSLDEIMKGIANELVYRSYVGSIEKREAHLEHGKLYGASQGMKVRVLDKKNKTVGLLEVTMTDKNAAKAKVMSGTGSIGEGMRVEEVKE